MKRGDIRWYEFKAPNKQRPVIILTRNSALTYLNDVTVAPITSRIRDIPTEVTLNSEDGLTETCVAAFDHMQTVPKNKIGKLIGKIEPNKWIEVKAAILFALDFGP